MRSLASVAERLAPFVLLGLPIALAFGPTLVEVCIGLLVGTLLVHSLLRHDWAWLRQGWLWLAIIWWAWLVMCSWPGIAAAPTWPRWTFQAVLMIRLPLCAASVLWVLRTSPFAARGLRWVVVLVAVYVVAQIGLQLVTGKNLFGFPMADNGLLSGPFDRPRAGPTLMHLFFPVLLPPVAWLLARGWLGWIGGTALLAAGVAVMLPIGQRMPVLLVGLGLVVAAILLPRLRRPALIAALTGIGVLALGGLAFPAAQHRMVTHFSEQMSIFHTSHYGLIYTRALAMAAQHPWHGRGFAGFRTGCEEARYFTPALGGTPADGGGAEICAPHAHHLYIEALTDAGWPGLVLFSAFVLAVLRALGRGLRASPEPLRVGLFIAALLHLWPLAASSAFTNIYMAGWFVLLLGWGLARAPGTRGS